MATEREVRLSGLRQRTRSREILITENGANADLSTREKNSSYRLRDHGEPSASNGIQKINDAVSGIALFVPTEANLDFKQFFFIWMLSSIIGRVLCLARVANDRTSIERFQSERTTTSVWRVPKLQTMDSMYSCQ